MRATVRTPEGLELREPDEEISKGDLILGMDAKGEFPEWRDAGDQVGSFAGNRTVAYRVTRVYRVMVQQKLVRDREFSVTAGDRAEAGEIALSLASRPACEWEGDTPCPEFEVLSVDLE